MPIEPLLKQVDVLKAENSHLKEVLTAIVEYASTTDCLTIADKPEKCVLQLVSAMIHNRDLEKARLQDEVNLLKAQLDIRRIEIEKAQAVFENGADDDLWKPGTTAVDTLISEYRRLQDEVRCLMEIIKQQ